MNNEVMTVSAVPQQAITRNVKAWSARTGSKEFVSNAITGADLVRELRGQGFATENVKISEGRTGDQIFNNDVKIRVNIPHEGQLTNDLVVLILPNKVESGTVSYKEAKEALKEIFEADKEFKAFVKEKIGNWTQFTTEQMNYVLDLYNGMNGNYDHSDEEAQNTETSVEGSPNIDDVKNAIDIMYQGIQTLFSGVALFNSAINKNTVSSITDEDLEEMASKLR